MPFIADPFADLRYAEHLFGTAAVAPPCRRVRIGLMGCDFLRRALRPLLNVKRVTA